MRRFPTPPQRYVIPRVLLCLFVLTWLPLLCSRAQAEDTPASGQAFTLADVQWRAGPQSIHHKADCQKSLAVSLPEACDGQDVGFTLQGTDPNQDSRCRLWVKYDEQTRSSAFRFHLMGNQTHQGRMNTMPHAPARLVHVTCWSGRFADMQLAVHLQCTPSQEQNEAFAKDLDKFLSIH
jgi:hypothetical protein